MLLPVAAPAPVPTLVLRLASFSGCAPDMLVPRARSTARPAAVPGGLPGVASGGVRLPVTESAPRWVAVEGGLPGVPSRGAGAWAVSPRGELEGAWIVPPLLAFGMVVLFGPPREAGAFCVACGCMELPPPALPPCWARAGRASRAAAAVMLSSFWRLFTCEGLLGYCTRSGRMRPEERAVARPGCLHI